MARTKRNDSQSDESSQASQEHVACANCTFLNPPNRKRCAMCSLAIRKRRRSDLKEDEEEEASTQVNDNTTQSSAKENPVGASSPQEQQEEAAVAPTASAVTSPRPSGAFLRMSNGGLARASAQSGASERISTLFSTASGAPVSVSRTSMAKAAQILGDALDEEPPASSTKQSDAKEDDDNEEDDDATAGQNAPDKEESATKRNGTEPKQVESTLFFTASGKSVTVSRASLAKAAAILEKFSQDDGEESDSDDDHDDDDDDETTEKASENQQTGRSGSALNEKSEKESAGEQRVSAPAIGAQRHSGALRLGVASPVLPTPSADTLKAGSRRGFVPPRSRDSESDTASPAMAASPSFASKRTVQYPQGGVSSERRASSDPVSLHNIAPTPSFPRDNLHAVILPPSASFPSNGIPASNGSAHVKPSDAATATSTSGGATANGAATPSPQLLSFNALDHVSSDVPLVMAAEDQKDPVAVARIASEVSSGSFRFSARHCSDSLLRLLGLPIRLPDVEKSVSKFDEKITLETRHFRQALLSLGALDSSCSTIWCACMIHQILRKQYELAVQCDPPTPEAFSPAYMLLFLVHRYNEEYIEGRRPILRRIAERDASVSSLMVLRIDAVHLEERLTPHTCVISVSDGWYTLKASLDMPLTYLARSGVLKCGQKLIVCARKLLLEGAAHPLEVSAENACALTLCFNSTKVGVYDAPLGMLLSTPPPVAISAIHPLGGAISVVRCVILRQLATFFVETMHDSSAGNQSRGGGGGGNGRRIVRSLVCEERIAEAHQHTCREKYDAVVEEMGVDAALAHVQATCGRHVSRVSSLLIADVDNHNEHALVQVWLDDRRSVSGGLAGLDSLDVPMEGSIVDIYNLSPAKSQTTPGPFPHAKLLYTRPPLHMKVVVSHQDSGVRSERHFYDSPEALENVSQGSVVDMIGLFVDSHTTERGTTFVVAFPQDRNVFAVIDVPMVVGFKELQLSIPCAPASSVGSGEDEVVPKLTPVVLQHATLLRYDESGVYTVVRLMCNEYTVLQQRPSQKHLHQLVQSAERVVDRLDDKQKLSVARCGRECLIAPPLASGPRGDSASRETEPTPAASYESTTNRGAPALNEAPSSASTANRRDDSNAPGEVREGSFSPRPSGANNNSVGSITTRIDSHTDRSREARAGSESYGSVTAARRGETSPSTNRVPYYLQNPRKSNQPLRSSGVIIPPELSNARVNGQSATTHEASPSSSPYLHLFGNIVELYIGESGDKCGELLNPSDPFMHTQRVPEKPKHAHTLLHAGIAGSHDEVKASCGADRLWFAFDFLTGDNNGTLARIHFGQDGPEMLSALLTECCDLTLQRLCALAVDEDNVEFSLQRSLVMSRVLSESEASNHGTPNSEVNSGPEKQQQQQRGGEELNNSSGSAAASGNGCSWWGVLRRSVVLPRALQRELEAESQKTLKHSTDKYSVDHYVLDVLTKNPNVRRWNATIVPDGRDALWWLESEWEVIRNTLIGSLTNVLFKITVRSQDTSLHRAFRLKTRCPVEDLFSVSSNATPSPSQKT